jgi:hypothetical protein
MIIIADNCVDVLLLQYRPEYFMLSLVVTNTWLRMLPGNVTDMKY